MQVDVLTVAITRFFRLIKYYQTGGKIVTLCINLLIEESSFFPVYE